MSLVAEGFWTVSFVSGSSVAGLSHKLGSVKRLNLTEIQGRSARWPLGLTKPGTVQIRRES